MLEKRVDHALFTLSILAIMVDILDKNKLGGKLVMRFCQILNSAGVPNVLWGNYLLTIYGVPTITDVCTLFSSGGTIAEQIIGCGLCRS